MHGLNNASINPPVAVHTVLASLNDLILVLFLVLLPTECEGVHGDRRHVRGVVVDRVEEVGHQPRTVVVTVEQSHEELTAHMSSCRHIGRGWNIHGSNLKLHQH